MKKARTFDNGLNKKKLIPKKLLYPDPNLNKNGISDCK
jgi:hypothetical protein